MHETRRLLEAATALSLLLRTASIPHAFYGSVLTAVLANSPLSDASIYHYRLKLHLQLARRPSGNLLYCRRRAKPGSSFSQSARGGGGE